MDASMRCRGMRDLLPLDMARFRRIEQVFRDVCQGWGYEEVRTPTIEHLHLFTSAGTLSPQMLGRVYSFLDWDGWSGERVVLRPDSTIPVARLYVEQAANRGIRRFFYVQNVLRFTQGDESREDWQCGVELIGDTQPLGDIELVLMACEALQRLGLAPDLLLSDPGILRAILLKAGFDLPEQLALYDRVLEGDLSALDEIQERLPDTPVSLHPLLTTVGEGADYLNNLQSGLSPAVPEIAQPLAELAAISQILEGVGTPHRIAPVLVRNFEYYTGPVFHFYVGGQKVGGGGRYDALIALVGGTSVPASGFALYLDVLAPMLGHPQSEAVAAVVIRPRLAERADLIAAFSLAGLLRQAGRRVRVSTNAEDAAGDHVIAGADGYLLVKNGAQPRSFRRADEVAGALTDRKP